MSEKSADQELQEMTPVQAGATVAAAGVSAGGVLVAIAAALASVLG